MISWMPLSLDPLREEPGKRQSRAPSEMADGNGKVKFVMIQWHICAFTGSARDVASGSDKTRVYVVLLLRVRVGVKAETSMLKIGGDVTFFGLILFPMFTVLCLDG